MASVPSVGINPSLFANSKVTDNGTLDLARTHKTELGQDDFLKLLVTKMSSQDPMNPQADTDFIAQMAQFSSLQQARDMTTGITDLKNRQDVMTANNLIGRNVTVTDADNKLIEGRVNAVSMDKGIPQVVIGGK